MVNLLRRAIYQALRGPREAREVAAHEAKRSTVRDLVAGPEQAPRMALVHRILGKIRKMHCAQGHKAEDDDQCIGVMTIDATGVHLSCARCGNLSHVADPDVVADALVEGLGPLAAGGGE